MKRADGTRVRNESPMYYLVPHILPKRYDSMNMCTVDIPIEPMTRYRNEKRKEGKQISNLALVLAAYMRAVAKYPELNRRLTKREYERAVDYALSLGFTDALIQEGKAAEESFIPAFDYEGV